MSKITLAGLGDFSDDEDESNYKMIAEAAKRHNLDFYPTYYDHELRGEADKIEALTMELWSMPRDEWGENLLTEAPEEA